MVKACPMRNATMLACVAVAGVACMPLLAQQKKCPSPCLIPPEFRAAQFVAPEGAPSKVVIASKDEPGERVIVTGRVLDGDKPIAGVSLFAFHGDANGQYAPGMDNREGEFNPRLHGALRTDSNGRYQYETTRHYYGGPAHVHYVVNASGYEPMLVDLNFEDDPIIVAKRKAGTPLLDVPAFETGPCSKSGPACPSIRPVKRDAQGVAHVTYDIQMVTK